MCITLEQFREELAHGPYAWPGGYARHGIASDGESLCFACCQAERGLIGLAIHGRDNSGWRVVGFAVHWEGEPITCAHCGAEIASEYGAPESEGAEQ